MTLSPYDLMLYAGALTILFITPGPVWVALIARTLSGGFNAAWPLALGVVVGDVVWPLFAVLGISWIVSVYADFMFALKIIAVLMFIWMGVMLIRHADVDIGEDSRLTRPGMWAGFVAGVAVILSNPKAVLFYMGVLPGFFDLTVVTWADIAVVCLLSMVIPLAGNLLLAVFVDRARALLTSGTALRRTNIVAGALLIGVAGVIALT